MRKVLALASMLVAASCSPSPVTAQDTDLTVINLVMIVRTGEDESTTSIREFKTVRECKEAEEIAQRIAKQSVGIIDLGTICVRSDFKSDSKRRS